MILTLGGFLYSQLTREKTLVDLSIFTNRNFLFGSILIFMFGAAIYSAVTILPLYFQSLMDYSAWNAGLVVSPRGLGSIIAMPLVGFLVAKIDTRVLVSTGFLIFGCCALVWGTLNLQISPWSLTVPIIISGFSLGLVFVPLSVVSLGDLKPQMVGNGSGLYNLMRNIGGSIGISVAQTILARHEQLHQTELTRDLAPTFPVVQQTLKHFQGVFSAAAALPDAQHQALGQVQRILTDQSQLWSYVDDFRYMALACFCCVPIVWCLKKVKARGAPAGAH
jgi:DHA2 family multidrug resistance protein